MSGEDFALDLLRVSHCRTATPRFPVNITYLQFSRPGFSVCSSHTKGRRFKVRCPQSGSYTCYYLSAIRVVSLKEMGTLFSVSLSRPFLSACQKKLCFSQITNRFYHILSKNLLQRPIIY